MLSINSAFLLLALALLVPLATSLTAQFQARWSIARLLGSAELALVALVWMLAFFAPMDSALLRLQPLNLTVLLLISFIALVVTHYSATGLAGEPGEERFLRWLALTRFAVMIVVASNNLFVLWLGWTGISISLHQLLLFYPERPRAILAAHKKFIIARLAEVLLGAACWLLYDAYGSAQISTVLAEARVSGLTAEANLAALLLAAVAIIKCAQMPLHGWLIQVVEAPTPVSALLHAGIVNLGGFLLLQFAPIFDASTAARWLVLLVAGPSTVLAALVMTTRISIKVRLAWSTTAQMGLMLVECALGLYELALLHLLAHACYKAHAFLSSGNAVNDYLAAALIGKTPVPARSWLLALGTAVLLLPGLLLVPGLHLPLAPWLVLLFAVLVVLSTWTGGSKRKQWAAALGSVALLLVAYGVAKWGATGLVMISGVAEGAYHPLQDAFVSILFAGLFLAWLVLQLWPRHALVQEFFIALNAGFYLDEWTTRLTLQLWPVRLPASTYKLTHSEQEYAL